MTREPANVSPTAAGHVRATLGLAAVAFALRAWFAWRFPMAPAWDGVLYERGARALASGLGYTTFMYVHRSSDTVPTAFYPVGYPAFLAVLYALFGAHVALMRMAGAAVSAASVALSHRTALRWATPRGALLASSLLAVMPGQVLFASAAMTEPLFGFLLVASVYALVRGRRLGITDLLVAAALFAASAYVRPQGLLLAAVLPALREGPFGRGVRGRVANAAVVTVISVAAIVPWSLRNCHRLDGCAFVSTNGGSNLAIGAVPRTHGTFFFLQPDDGCRGVVGEVARDHCWRSVALHAIAAHPLHWLALAFPKVEHTISYESFPSSYFRESLRIQNLDGPSWLPRDADREHALSVVLTAFWRTLLIFAVLALLPRPGAPPLPDTARVAIAGIAFSLATHAVFFGGDRYHLAFAPLVTVLAAGAFRSLHVKPHARERVTVGSARVRTSWDAAARG